jgi:hypothetical protein
MSVYPHRKEAQRALRRLAAQRPAADSPGQRDAMTDRFAHRQVATPMRPR